MALLTNDQRVLAPVLNGAQTLWTGRPLPGFRLRTGDWGQMFMGVVTIVFFLFWESMVVNGNAPWFFPLFGLVVFGLALWQSFGQLAWDWYARGRTYYALTQDGFALMYTDAFRGMTKRVYLPALSEIGLEIRGDGSGTIAFGRAKIPPWWLRNRTWNVERPPAFEFIPNASEVYDICAKLQTGKV